MSDKQRTLRVGGMNDRHMDRGTVDIDGIPRASFTCYADAVVELLVDGADERDAVKLFFPHKVASTQMRAIADAIDEIVVKAEEWRASQDNGTDNGTEVREPEG